MMNAKIFHLQSVFLQSLIIHELTLLDIYFAITKFHHQFKAIPNRSFQWHSQFSITLHMM